MNNKKKVAIVGSGISGLSAAYFLKDTHDVTLFEKNDRLGGHSRTIEILHQSGKRLEVDTGFIVLNDRTYPNLTRLFQKLNIPLEKTEMSFAVSVNQGELEWSGTSLNTLFAQRSNLCNIKMLKGLRDVLFFNKNVSIIINQYPHLTLGQLITQMRLSDWFRDFYLLPMGGTIWSCSDKTMLDFPAISFVNFFKNHGLLSITNRPQWFTLKNKSMHYVKTIEESISEKCTLFKSVNIQSICRYLGQICIAADNKIYKFDDVVFACHPAEIKPILFDANPIELSFLSKFTRHENSAYTHSDQTQMPRIKKCWSSWNYLYKTSNRTQQISSDGNPVSVTYWMNKLQHISDDSPLFVTLNPITPIRESLVYDFYTFHHPIFDQSSIEGQKMLADIQGKNGLWFCGAYLRYGFHEDGIWSAIMMLKKMGVIQNNDSAWF